MSATLSDKSRPRHLSRELAILVIVALVAVSFVRTFVVQAYYIPSESMVPQLEVGDRVLASKISLRLHDPRRGDLIVFDCPPKAPCPKELEGSAVGDLGQWVMESLGVRPPSTDEYIKRVIGIGGEAVQARDGLLYIDGRQLIEPYLPRGVTTSDFGPVEVPKGELWVMGDNRAQSLDSRVFGTIKIDTVVGRAVTRIWPFGRMAFL
ncbi:MAG: signal peptidase I [Acidimicrobiales bacterium]